MDRVDALITGYDPSLSDGGYDSKRDVSRSNDAGSSTYYTLMDSPHNENGPSHVYSTNPDANQYHLFGKQYSASDYKDAQAIISTDVFKKGRGAPNSFVQKLLDADIGAMSLNSVSIDREALRFVVNLSSNATGLYASVSVHEEKGIKLFGERDVAIVIDGVYAQGETKSSQNNLLAAPHAKAKDLEDAIKKLAPEIAIKAKDLDKDFIHDIKDAPDTVLLANLDKRIAENTMLDSLSLLTTIKKTHDQQMVEARIHDINASLAIPLSASASNLNSDIKTYVDNLKWDVETASNFVGDIKVERTINHALGLSEHGSEMLEGLIGKHFSKTKAIGENVTDARQADLELELVKREFLEGIATSGVCLKGVVQEAKPDVKRCIEIMANLMAVDEANELKPDTEFPSESGLSM